MSTIAEYARRPLRAAEADGLNDLLSGISLLAMALLWISEMQFQTTIRGHSFWESHAFHMALPLFLLVMVGTVAVTFLSKRGVESLRQRFVYPRIGYVSPRVAPAHRATLIRAMAVGAAVSIAAVGGTLTILATRRAPAGESVALPALHSEAMLVVFGAIFVVAYLRQFAKLGFVRHLVIAGIALTASLVLLMLDLVWHQSVDAISMTPVLRDAVAVADAQFGMIGMEWILGILGASLIAAGAITFTRLVGTPRSAAEQEAL